MASRIIYGCGCAECGDDTYPCEQHKSEPTMTSDALLTERGATHGKFSDNARNGQALRDLFRQSPHWADMDPVCREALDMISTKLSRILSGQAEFKDHWVDLIGYATLALKQIDGEL